MKRFKVKRQPPVKGGRAKFAASLMHEIDIELTAIARYCRVSKSWAAAVILADALRVKGQVHYDVPRIRRVK